jgi:hypothetical protein
MSIIAEFYASPADEPGLYDWDAAKARCESKGMKVPDAVQLNHLYKHRTAIAGFNQKTDSHLADWYWSSQKYPPDPTLVAWGQKFDSGYIDWRPTSSAASVRCVRN